MAAFNPEEMIVRFRERAAAVRRRPLPPVAGEERQLFLQQAQVDYINKPDAANKLILQLVNDYSTGWVYSEGVAKFSVEQQKKLGLVGNGPDQTLGNFDEARITKVIGQANPIFKAAGKKVKDDLKASDLFTNEFVDTKIKL